MMKCSISRKKGIVSKAWYWKRVASEVQKKVGRPFRFEYIRDCAYGQRSFPAIKQFLKEAIESVDEYLTQNKLRVVDGRRKIV